MTRFVVTRKDIAAAFAKGMRDFGYPDVTDEMGLELYEAFKAGTSPLPHGIIGMFAERQFKELVDHAADNGRELP